MQRLLLCLLLLADGVICRGDIILSIDPSAQTVSLGSPASFSVDVSGLGNGTALGTYDINLGFNPALLLYSSIVFGNQLDLSGLGDIQSVTPGIGTVEVFELSLDSPNELNSLQASSFTLATLTFNTLATGANSPVTLSVNALGDAYGNSITADITDGSLTISPSNFVTPEARPIGMMVIAAPLLWAAVVKQRTSRC